MMHPFTTDLSCPKCGSFDLDLLYQRGGSTPNVLGTIKEHIQITCNLCEYVFGMTPKDVQTTPPGRPE